MYKIYAYIYICYVSGFVCVSDGAQRTSTFVKNEGIIYVKTTHLSRVVQVSKENFPLQH